MKQSRQKFRNQNLNTVVFDFDNTLFFLPVDWKRLKAEIVKLLNLNVKPADIMIAGLLEGLEARGLKNEYRSIRNLIEKREVESSVKATPNKPILDFYRRCLDKDFNVAILTTNYKKTVLATIKRFNAPKPHFIIDREGVKKIKPDSEGIMKILEHFKAKPGQTLMVGDSWKDREVARRVGTRFFSIENIDSAEEFLFS